MQGVKYKKTQRRVYERMYRGSTGTIHPNKLMRGVGRQFHVSKGGWGRSCMRDPGEEESSLTREPDRRGTNKLEGKGN